MNYKEVKKILKCEGWSFQTGGRHIKAIKGKQRVPIPVHGNKDIKLGTLKQIEKQTGVSLTKRDKK